MHTIGLPIYERVNKDNIKIGDIITSLINKKRHYYIIINITDTMIVIKNLDVYIDDEKVIFEINDTINNITKNYLSFSRQIHKVINIKN